MFVGQRDSNYCDSLKQGTCQALSGVNAYSMGFLTTDLVQEVTLPKNLGMVVPSGYAALNDIKAVEALGVDGDYYKRFLNSPMANVRALAVSLDPKARSSVYKSGGPDPITTAMKLCEEKASGPCKLYAVDDQVVW